MNLNFKRAKNTVIMKNALTKSYGFLFSSVFILILFSFSSMYAQTITTTSVNSTVVCRGSLINVNFTTNGAFQAGSYYKIQLSNASGVFSGNYIGELELQNSTSSNSVVSRTIAGEIQSSIATGNGYKVRVVYFVNTSTPPTVIGSTFTSNISIVSSQVTPTFSLPTSICSGTPLTLPTTSTNGVTGTWSPSFNNTVTANTTTNYIFTPTTGFCANTATRTITVNANVTPTFNQVQAVCSGTTINSLPTQSLNNITGSWSPALNNTATTTYTFTPSPSTACVLTQTMTVVVTPKTTPTFGAFASICSGDTISQLPQTSLNGISGSWYPSINNVETTTYTFTPSNNFCATTTTGTMVVNPSATIDTTVASCQTYTWPANGQTYTTSGNYTFITGCTKRILHLTISQPGVLVAPVLSSFVQTGLCSAGNPNPNYSVLPIANASSYEWTVPEGASIITGQGSASIAVSISNGFTSGMLSVKAINGCTTSVARAISIFSVLPIPGLITGETRGLCSQALNSITYSVPTFQGASDYLWTTPTGTEITSGQGSNIINLNFTSNFTSGNLSVEARNVCGSSIKRIVVLNSVPLAPGLISGTCHGLGTNGITTTTYSITNSLGATDYLWTIPTGATIVSGQGTNTITLNFTSSFTSGSLSVEARNACGSSLKRTMALYSVPLTPGLITGATNGLCSQGLSSTTYSIASVAGAVDYLWTIPAGTTIVSGQGTNSITLNFTSSFSTGSLSVEARNACGSSLKRTIALNSIPLAPGLITGASVGLGTNGITTETYTIPSVVGAVDYLWTIPAGIEVVSGQGTNSITLNFTSSFTAGCLHVEARNACGNSIKRMLNLYSVPFTPGAITGTTNNLCPSGVSNPTYTIAAVIGATSYTWTAPSGTTIVSGQGTNTVTLSVSSSFSIGLLSVTANNACGPSVVRTLTLNSTPLTPASITGSIAPCGTETYTCSTVAQAVSYTWTVPTGMVIVSGQGTNSITVNVTSSTVSANITVKASNNCKTGAAKSLLVSACGARTMLTATDDATTEDATTAIITASKVEAVVYPNPTNGEVNIEFTNELKENVTIEMYDMLGNKVSNIEMTTGSTFGNLSLDGMSSGFYLLQVSNSNKSIIYKTKVSKQ